MIFSLTSDIFFIQMQCSVLCQILKKDLLQISVSFLCVALSSWEFCLVNSSCLALPGLLAPSPYDSDSLPKFPLPVSVVSKHLKANFRGNFRTHLICISQASPSFVAIVRCLEDFCFTYFILFLIPSVGSLIKSL